MHVVATPWGFGLIFIDGAELLETAQQLTRMGGALTDQTTGDPQLFLLCSGKPAQVEDLAKTLKASGFLVRDTIHRMGSRGLVLIATGEYPETPD